MNRIRIGMTVCAICACSLAASGIARAQASTQVLRGDITAIEGSSLQLRSDTGQAVTVALADKVRVNVRVPVKPDAITQGAYVGVTATPQPDGTLLASIVSIFPESLRGTAEGHRPMDALPGRTMTNATVASVGGRSASPAGTMTSATVANVGGIGHSETLKLTYAGGEKTVTVPENATVVRSEPADRSVLVPGTHVVVYAAPAPDGTLTAARVSAGKDGSVPPN